MSKKSKQSSDRSSPGADNTLKVNLKSDSLTASSFQSEFVSGGDGGGGGTTSLLWKHLKQEDFVELERLGNETNPSHSKLVESYLAKLFDLEEYETDLFQALILEYYMIQYWWAAKEANFSTEQTSIFFSIAYTLFNSLKGGGGEGNTSAQISDSIQDLKNVLTDLCQSSKSCAIFSETQIKQIIDQLTLTLFQNYQAFKFAFKHPQQECVIKKKIVVECPKQSELPFPPPLQEAMPERMHNKYVLKLEDPEDMKSNENEESKEDSPENIALSAELVEQINNKFVGISIEDAKKIIFEVTNELVDDLKDSMKTKIKDRETALIEEITKSNEIVNAKGGGAKGDNNNNRKKSAKASRAQNK